ncbi:hypothetical protein GGI25_000215 [Coemansia spiralis]|uniref:Uncharacterized protein n=2 Tax=Coemansia TaxID=4863 RepID=A0A9W8G7S1_9FUNG|nr:hypothetical protein BX070DRAFT_227548 [Coemansia spiralis]KAJ1995910.1 hypothetical protein EDC05_000570 [Coemansia umbellata]KAJ2625788.1 hypothetical protein GGI26_000249 [Coemansia sp. RSA 1358]KAJ2680911.1 hypothetical protein GGI25_000215 [Coemansia spiralis]
MFDYPPSVIHHHGQGGYPNTGFTQTTARLRALSSMAKRRRHDISIGIQSALSAVYAVELVFYFVRLRHLSGASTAAWRACLMFSLLILDMCLIWLTVRSKRKQVLESPHPHYTDNSGRHANAAATGNFNSIEPAPHHVSTNPFADMPMNRFNGPLPDNAPHMPENYQHYNDRTSAHRSHLNTPIIE